MSIPSFLKNKTSALVFILICISSLLPALTLADNHTTASGSTTEYKLLAPLPYVDPDGDRMAEAGPYIEGAVKLTIIVSGVLAVIMIMYGGIKYMSTDAFSGKSEAKGVIQNALWGLALVLGSWMILYTINPKLVNLDLSIERFIPQESSNTVDVTDPSEPTNPEDPGGVVPPGETLPGGRCLGSACPTDTPNMVDLSIDSVENEGIVCKYSPCKVNRLAAPLVRNLVVMANLQGVSWRITEAYPPTSTHASRCHYNGGCVDMAPINPSAANFAALCRSLRNAGMAIYSEVGTTFNTSEVRLVCGPNHNTRFGTGPHLHVNF